VDVPEIRYARSGDVAIGYQVLGDGPVDIVLGHGASNLVWGWQHPLPAGFYRELASFGRLILFDHRGQGVSDRPNQLPGFDVCMDDIRAVLDATGSERAVIVGSAGTAYVGAHFAAAYPERCRALVLHRPALPGADPARWIREAHDRWGERDYHLDDVYEGADAAYADWWINLLRLTLSPQAAAARTRWFVLQDARAVLPSIHVPTLVVRWGGNPVGESEVAALIDGASLVTLEGPGGNLWLIDGLAAEIRAFVEGLDGEPVADRVLATLLFTDIVGSTDRAVQLGDRLWKDLLSEHHRVVRREVRRFQGREHDTAGDGFFASFDTPARAIRCAMSITDAAHAIHLDIRQGVHTGECETFDGKLAGIAIVVAARIAAKASAGEILVSVTVKELAAGSELEFVDRGEHELKGIPGRVRTYAVVP
jgi:class 3 adenylate cyclase/pimeloyl-ACP methyl ester carboxylesterase